MKDPAEDKNALIHEIKRCASFAIVSHENPDGDAIGAELALAIGLESLGKLTGLYCKDPVPRMYDFLPEKERFIVCRDVKMDEGQILIAVDCGDLDRTGLTFIPERPALIINIDHHISNTRFGDLNWVNAKASAASEMIFLLLRLLDVKITTSIAATLYTGIMSDTGSFQFSNTTSRCLKIAGELIDFGADPNLISTSVYDRKSIASLRLTGIVLQQMEIYPEQGLAMLCVTEALLDSLHATYEDTEELVNLPLRIREIDISILIKEIGPGAFKISMRSKNRVNVSEIAGTIGGGGHPNAAGAKMQGELDQVKKEILKMFK